MESSSSAHRSPRRRLPWVDVPPTRRKIMASNRRRDTAPEKAIRSALHRRGLRFRVDLPIRVASGRPVRPDVVFPKQRIAVFVDGCFWHGCPVHGTAAVTNARYWSTKIAENQDRDRRQAATLADAGWTVLRVWEHEDPEVVAVLVERTVMSVSEAA